MWKTGKLELQNFFVTENSKLYENMHQQKFPTIRYTLYVHTHINTHTHTHTDINTQTHTEMDQKCTVGTHGPSVRQTLGAGPSI